MALLLVHFSSYLNIVHIPDKPGQSHNTQEFERTLNEVMNLISQFISLLSISVSSIYLV